MPGCCFSFLLAALLCLSTPLILPTLRGGAFVIIQVTYFIDWREITSSHTAQLIHIFDLAESLARLLPHFCSGFIHDPRCFYVMRRVDLRVQHLPEQVCKPQEHNANADHCQADRRKVQL